MFFKSFSFVPLESRDAKRTSFAYENLHVIFFCRRNSKIFVNFLSAATTTFVSYYPNRCEHVLILMAE